MKKEVKIGVFVTLVFILLTIVATLMLLNGNKILKNFNITSVSNVFTKYTIKFDRVKAATKYKIIITDSNDIKVFDTETEKNINEIELTSLEYGAQYSVMVYAYDKLGDYRPCNKVYNFTFNEPSFGETTELILNDEDNEIYIQGDIKDKKYYIVGKIGDKEVFNDELKSNDYTIPAKLYEGQSVQLDVSIVNSNTVIDHVSMFNNMNPLTDITITSPIMSSIEQYNDLSLNFTGGYNALQYILNVYQGKNLIKTTEIKKKNCVLSKNIFTPGSEYRIEVIASFNDYTKSSSVTFTMNDKKQLRPVYISNNWKYVKQGSKITLSSPDSNATIYYTTDGTNPESFGHVYKEPIVVNENMTIKAVAVNDTSANSIISSYDINVGEKKQLVIYLSPSNQRLNLGVASTGFTNERDEMNDVSNYIEERLKSNGVTVIRNNSSGNINQWIKESLYCGADLHIAVHSNASTAHTSFGIETWINSETSPTYSFAQNLQNNLMSIYPNTDPIGNRGVKYAEGALGEANDAYLPFGLLVEVAHHDYESDALWIMQNKKLIGYNIADSILAYYQII